MMCSHTIFQCNGDINLITENLNNSEYCNVLTYLDNVNLTDISLVHVVQRLIIVPHCEMGRMQISLSCSYRVTK